MLRPSVPPVRSVLFRSVRLRSLVPLEANQWISRFSGTQMVKQQGTQGPQ